MLLEKIRQWFGNQKVKKPKEFIEDLPMCYSENPFEYPSEDRPKKPISDEELAEMEPFILPKLSSSLQPDEHGSLKSNPSKETE